MRNAADALPSKSCALALIVLIHRSERGARRLRQAAAAGDALLLHEQLFDRRHRRHFGLELGQLIAQQIETRFAVLGGGV